MARLEAAKPVQNLVISHSGGLDSTVLAHLTYRYRDRLQKFLAGDIQVLHFNFNLRGIDSQADAEFARALAAKLGFAYEEISCEKFAASGSVQEWARKERQKAFEERRLKGDVIVTGHHADDHVETFLFRLTREIALDRVAFFPQFDAEKRMFRPLLGMVKTDLKLWAESEGIEHRHDKSNDESLYQRNFLRHEIIPRLAHIAPQASGHILGHAQQLEELYRFFDSVFATETALTELSHTFLTSLPLSLRLRLLRGWIKVHAPSARWVPDHTLKQILESKPDGIWQVSEHAFVKKVKKGYIVEYLNP